MWFVGFAVLMSSIKYLRSSNKPEEAILNLPRDFNNVFQSNQIQQIAGMKDMFRESNATLVSMVQLEISRALKEQWDKIEIVTNNTSKASNELHHLVRTLSSNLGLMNDRMLNDFNSLRSSLDDRGSNSERFISQLNKAVENLHNRVAEIPSRKESDKRDEQLIGVLVSRFPVPLVREVMPTNKVEAERFFERVIKMEADIASLIIMLQTDKVADVLRKMEFTVNDVRRVLETDLYKYVLKSVPYLVNLHRAIEEKTKYEDQKKLKLSLLSDIV